jgi:hypothetical protein
LARPTPVSAGDRRPESKSVDASLDGFNLSLSKYLLIFSIKIN